jgi:hypothetical protein
LRQFSNNLLPKVICSNSFSNSATAFASSADNSGSRSAGRSNVEVEFSLKSKINPIGVAEYHLQSKLPAEFKGRLPSARQLANAVRDILSSEN